MTHSLFHMLIADIRFYHQLYTHGKELSFFSALVLPLKSRGLWLLWIQRLNNHCYQHRQQKTISWWCLRLMAAFGKFRSTVISKSEFQDDCKLGERIYLPDAGYLICGAKEIGDGTVLHDHVIFGFANRPGSDGRPSVGKDVWIGSRCVIAGAIEIGDGSTILPGTYVTFDVPPRSVVRGNPGRVISNDFDNGGLRASLESTYEALAK